MQKRKRKYDPSSWLNQIISCGLSCTLILFTVLASQYCSTASNNMLPLDHGVISNHVTDQLGCGSSSSPWRIEAEAGRTVEISLLDFKALDRARSHTLVTCSDVYGFILEKTLNINQTICGQNVRESVIYKSKTNSIEIHIKPKSGSKFTLTYIGK